MRQLATRPRHAAVFEGRLHRHLECFARGERFGVLNGVLEHARELRHPARHDGSRFVGDGAPALVGGLLELMDELTRMLAQERGERRVG
jgi:hypothetical protein